jgi:FKBP-type peptidyl-prolyl cis-trans isomerase
MIFKLLQLNSFYWMIGATCCIMACNSVPEGFHTLDEVVSKKLISFGAGDRNVGQADFVLMRWEVLNHSSDSMQTAHEAMIANSLWSGYVMNQTILADLQSLEDGAMVEYLAPAGAFAMNQISDPIHVAVTIVKCFESQKSAAQYLATSASEGLRSEEECMDLYTSLRPELNWVAYNDLWLGYKVQTQGDSIKIDKQVVIDYHTYLLSGEQLDSLTTMEFPFGKSGQLLPAMQWGLAKMKEGESALILAPSQWAFGVEGAPKSKIPAQTPIFWDVKVVRVANTIQFE